MELLRKRPYFKGLMRERFIVTVLISRVEVVDDNEYLLMTILIKTEFLTSMRDMGIVHMMICVF